MSAMVGRLCINEAKIIDANRCEAETKSLRNYQSLLREIYHISGLFLMKKYLGPNSTMLAPCARPLEIIIEIFFRIVQQLQNQVSHHRELKNFFSNNLQQMIAWRRKKK